MWTLLLQRNKFLEVNFSCYDTKNASVRGASSVLIQRTWLNNIGSKNLSLQFSEHTISGDKGFILNHKAKMDINKHLKLNNLSKSNLRIIRFETKSS